MSAHPPNRCSTWPSTRSKQTTSSRQGESGLFMSRDAGRRWRPLSRDPTGLLAWAGALYLVDAQGRIQRSDDAGRGWVPRGQIGGQPAALASHAGDLYVALHDGTVKRSTDGGRTWTVRVAA